MEHPFVIEAPEIHASEGFPDMVIGMAENIFRAVAERASASFFGPQELMEMVECHFTWKSNFEPKEGRHYHTEFTTFPADETTLEKHRANQGMIATAEADEYECRMVIVSRMKHLLN